MINKQKEMTPYKQHHRAARTHAVERRADQYRSVAGLARALVRTLAVSYVALSAGPALAASPPRAILSDQSSKISDKCTDFRNLVTITQAVENFGGPLAAKQDKIYVTEAAQPKGGGAHLRSAPVFVPAMKSGARIWLKIPVGTTESYRGKLPGHLHLLYVHLAAKGKKDVLGGALLIEFPKGYCQPPDPKIIRESYRVDRDCKDDKRLVTLDVTVKNVGGPLLEKHRYPVNVYENGHARFPHTLLGTGPFAWVPPLAHGAEAHVKIPVGKSMPLPEFLESVFLKRLPGSHSLTTEMYDANSRGRQSTKFVTTIKLPEGICRPLTLTRPTPSQMHLRISRTLAVRPPPLPPRVVRTGHGIPHPRPSRMRLMHPKGSGARAAGRNRIPGLLAPSAIHLKKKLSPAQPKIKLSPPTMRLPVLR